MGYYQIFQRWSQYGKSCGLLLLCEEIVASGEILFYPNNNKNGYKVNICSFYK